MPRRNIEEIIEEANRLGYDLVNAQEIEALQHEEEARELNYEIIGVDEVNEARNEVEQDFARDREQRIYHHTFDSNENGKPNVEELNTFKRVLDGYESGLRNHTVRMTKLESFNGMLNAILQLKTVTNKNDLSFLELKKELKHTLSSISIFLASRGVNVNHDQIDLEGIEFENPYEEQRVHFASQMYEELCRRENSIEELTRVEEYNGPSMLGLVENNKAFGEIMSKKMINSHNAEDMKRQRILTDAYSMLLTAIQNAKNEMSNGDTFSKKTHENLVKNYTLMLQMMDLTGLEVPGLRQTLESDLQMLAYAEVDCGKTMDQAMVKITDGKIAGVEATKEDVADALEEIPGLFRLLNEGKKGVWGGTEYYKSISTLLLRVGGETLNYNGSVESARTYKHDLEQLKNAAEVYIGRKMAQSSLKEKELRRVEAAKQVLAFADSKLNKIAEKSNIPAKNASFDQLKAETIAEAQAKFERAMTDRNFMDRVNMLQDVKELAEAFGKVPSVGRLVIEKGMGSKTSNNTDKHFDELFKNMIVGCVLKGKDPTMDELLGGMAFQKKYRVNMAETAREIMAKKPADIQNSTVLAIEKILKHLSSSGTINPQFLFASKLLTKSLLKDKDGNSIIDKLPKDLQQTVRGIEAIEEIARKGSDAAAAMYPRALQDKTGMTINEINTQEERAQLTDLFAMRVVEEKLRAFASKEENHNSINSFFSQLADPDTKKKLMDQITASAEYKAAMAMDARNVATSFLKDNTSIRELFANIADKAFGKETEQVSKETEKEMFDGFGKVLSEESKKQEAEVQLHQ